MLLYIQKEELMVYIIGLATIISTLLGGWFALHLKDKLHLVIGFSAGAVLGVALFDLLPESLALEPNVRLVTILVAVGFVFYMVLDRFLSLHQHDEENCKNPSHGGKLGLAALIFHSFLDGFGIGLAFKISPTVGWIVAVAVLAHDFSDGINTVSLVLRSYDNWHLARRWLIVDALAPAVGILATTFLYLNSSTLGLVLAIFTGLFLFIGASDLIPESHHHHPTVWTTLMTVLGIAFMFLVIHFAI